MIVKVLLKRNKNILKVVNKEYKLNFNANNFFRMLNLIENPHWNVFRIQVESIKLPNNEELNIGKGEKILTEISRKFSEETLRELFNLAHLTIIKSYTDKKKYFTLYLLKSKKYL